MISLSDGSLQALLPLTPITVTDAPGRIRIAATVLHHGLPCAAEGVALGSNPPTRHTDVSLCQQRNWETYQFYYGKSADALDQLLEVDRGTSTFTVDELGPGTHYSA